MDSFFGPPPNLEICRGGGGPLMRGIIPALRPFILSACTLGCLHFVAKWSHSKSASALKAIADFLHFLCASAYMRPSSCFLHFLCAMAYLRKSSCFLHFLSTSAYLREGSCLLHFISRVEYCDKGRYFNESRLIIIRIAPALSGVAFKSHHTTSTIQPIA